MSERLDVRRAIRDHLLANYAGGLTLQLDSTAKDQQPASGTSTGGGYIRSWINWGAHEPITAGAQPYRRSTNSLVLEIAVPADAGDGALDEQTDHLASILRGQLMLSGDVEFWGDQPLGVDDSDDALRRVQHLWFFTWTTVGHPEIDDMRTKTVAQASHGLAVGDWIGFGGSGWAKVTATAGQPRCSGVVVTVVDADTFLLVPVGLARLAVHGYTAGPLYLSQSTAGAVVSTAPTSGIVQRVGLATDADTVIVEQGEAVQL